MTNINKYPAPEKLLRQITAETINALGLGGETDHPTTAKLEAGIGLIAKAWEMPQEAMQNSIDLIQRQKQNILSGSGESVLPKEEDLESYDGPMIVELLWGLFETAVKLEDAQDRVAIHELAVLMADSLNLDEWIEKCGPSNGQNLIKWEGLSRWAAPSSWQGDDTTSNQKFEITEIAHEKYPFLHRIRALRDRAVVCGCAYVSHKTEMSGDSRAEDDACVRGAKLSRCARVSGNGMVLQSPTTKAIPILTGSCAVYGKVMGDVMLAGAAVVISDETISNDSLDTLSIDERGRTILRAPSRDELVPCQPQAQQKKPKDRGRDR